MKTSQLFQSKYLDKDDVGNGLVLTVQSITIENLAMEGQPEELKPICGWMEAIKPMVVNQTNLQLMEHIFGSDETNDWIGRQIVVYKDPTVSFGGRLVGGLRVRTPEAAAVPIQSQPGTQPPPSPGPAAAPPPYQTPAMAAHSPSMTLEEARAFQATIEAQALAAQEALHRTPPQAPPAAPAPAPAAPVYDERNPPLLGKDEIPF